MPKKEIAKRSKPDRKALIQKKLAEYAKRDQIGANQK
tara:strand:- start:6433 stop:6543 length:111 start_codon:yes stop_codon:yes gene_type:complete